MLETSLTERHRALGARMVDFAGWDMPVQYTGIVAEAEAVRRAAGLFDLGHMGRVMLTGPDRAAFLDRLVTNQVRDLGIGAARYALMCNERGGVLDDVIYYTFPGLILLVVNASNRTKILAWLEAQRRAMDVVVEDVTLDYGMVAIQGPRAVEIMTPLTDLDLTRVKGYSAAGGTVLGVPCMVARTGYTGEDGFELYFDARRADYLWQGLSAAGREAGLMPCGLGSRDTLRLEAGMPLYGHELDEQTSPLEAGLEFALRLDKGPFVGREALLAEQQRGSARRLLGFLVEGRRIARQGATLHLAGADERCGVVVSGTQSPTLGRSIFVASVDAGLEEQGAAFEVDLGRRRVAATVTRLPFYKRKRKKKKKKKADA